MLSPKLSPLRNRNVLAILAMAMGYSGFGYAYPVSNRFYQQLGFSLSEIQWLRSVHTLTYIVVLLLLTYLVAKVRTVRLAQLGALFAITAAGIYYFTPFKAMCYLAEICHAVGVGAMLVCIPELLRVEAISKGAARDTKLLIGIAVFIEMSSWVVANLIGTYVATATNFVNAYGLATLSFAVSFIGSLLLRDDSRTARASTAFQVPNIGKLKRTMISSWPIVTAFGCFAGGYRALLSLQPSYLELCGLTLNKIGIISAVLYIVVSFAALTAPLVGRLGIAGQVLLFALMSSITLFGGGMVATTFIGPMLLVPFACVRGWSRVTVVNHAQSTSLDSLAGSAVSALFLAERVGAFLWLFSLGVLLQHFPLQNGLLFIGVFRTLILCMLIFTLKTCPRLRFVHRHYPTFCHVE